MKATTWCATLLLALAVSTTGWASAAMPATVAIKDVKVPHNMTLAEGSQKALFTHSQDLKQFLLDKGVLRADIYQLRYKVDNVFSYALVMDICFGEDGLRSLGIESKMPIISLKKKQVPPSVLPELAAIINTNGMNTEQAYRVVEPLKEQKNGTYVGTLRFDNTLGDVIYSETLHIVLYNDVYSGASARIVALSSLDDGAFWPLVKEFTKVIK